MLSVRNELSAHVPQNSTNWVLVYRNFQSAGEGYLYNGDKLSNWLIKLNQKNRFV